MKPPSVRLKEVFTPSFTEDDIKKAAKEVMLSIEDVTLWFEHLKTIHRNRQRGASKAAATRKAKHIANQQKQGDIQEAQEDLYFCGTCGHLYQDKTEEYETWIACDK